MPAKKKPVVEVDLYAPFARWRTDLLRISARCFGSLAHNDGEMEDEVKGSLFVAVIREDQKAFGFVIVSQAWPETANLHFIAIDPDYQGKGYLPKLLGPVIEELRTIGFKFWEVDAREATLAPKIAKAFAEDIIASHPHESKLGPMRFFRVDLNAKRKQEPQAGTEADSPVGSDNGSN
jgi:GNAT superfamily N-acetyltransferase